MKISHKKLQTYFSEQLPSAQVLADAFTFHAFEIEAVENDGDDTILDIKVLPDRACYAKSYEGIAREVSTILNLKRKDELVKFDSNPRTILINTKKINEVLGSDISVDEMISILNRMDIKVKMENDNKLTITVPSDRLDLQTWRDIPEEVGRIYGYDKIRSTMSSDMSFKPLVEKNFYYSEKIKNILVDLGFSEVYTYSLVPKGDFEIEKPLASDKNFLRANLSDGISKSLEFNAKNAELLGLEAIKIFEIGKVFTKEGESTHVSIGAVQVKKVKGLKGESFVAAAIETLEKAIEVSIANKKIATQGANSAWEIDLDEIIKSLPEPTSYTDLNFQPATNNIYKKFSPYPFIVRDIAVFVPESIQAGEVWTTIENGITEAGATDLLVKHSKFDEFKKDGKVSYGFRMVFQSAERTLTIEEANAVMEKVNSHIKEKGVSAGGAGWEVR